MVTYVLQVTLYKRQHLIDFYLMRYYRYNIKNKVNTTLNASVAATLFDLATVLPIEIVSILEVYAKQKSEVSLQVQTGGLTYTIQKIA